MRPCCYMQVLELAVIDDCSAEVNGVIYRTIDLVEVFVAVYNTPRHIPSTSDFWSRASCISRLLTKLMEELTPDRHTHCMPWVNYCSSGQRSKPPGGVLENFLEVEVSFAD